MTIPLAIWIYDLSGMGLVWTGLTIALVVWRHKANIGRMVKGSEQKVPT